jgi:hypothetical protein
VPEVIEAKEYSNKRTIFITYNKKKVIVQA